MAENDKINDKEAEKKHYCSVCGKPSDSVICPACEQKIRGETAQKKRKIEKKS